MLWVAYLLVSKGVRAKVETVRFMFVVSLIGALTVSALVILGSNDLGQVHGAGWAWVTLLALGPGIAGHGLVAWAQPRVDASVTSVLIQAEPVGASAAAWVILGQRISLAQAVAMAAVVAALCGAGPQRITRRWARRDRRRRQLAPPWDHPLESGRLCETVDPTPRRWGGGLLFASWVLGRRSSQRLGTSTTDATTTSTSPPTSAVTTTAVDVVEGFNPPCVESTSNDAHFRFADESALDTFGPLAGEPALRVTLPLGRSNEVPELQAPGVSQARIPGGVLLAVGASSYGDFDGGILTAIDADGESRWVRCFDDRIYRTSVAPASSSAS